MAEEQNSASLTHQICNNCQPITPPPLVLSQSFSLPLYVPFAILILFPTPLTSIFSLLGFKNGSQEQREERRAIIIIIKDLKGFVSSLIFFASRYCTKSEGGRSVAQRPCSNVVVGLKGGCQ